MSKKRDSIEKNFFMGRVLVGIANALAIGLFIVAYMMAPNVWYIYAAVGLGVATILFFIFVKNQEMKYYRIKARMEEHQKKIGSDHG
ncbi:MAG: hypothetical protein ACLFQX_08700 [Candidatus Kapaibacterium sp.]